jgi:hypothetical protein
MKRAPGKYNFYYDPFGEVCRNCCRCRYVYGKSRVRCVLDAPGPDRFCGFNSSCDKWAARGDVSLLPWEREAADTAGSAGKKGRTV